MSVRPLQVHAAIIPGPSGLPAPESVLEKFEDLGPWARAVPRIVRLGPGSLEQQIQRRAYFPASGGERPWQEPSYARGNALPEPAKKREQILWNAALGRGPAAITRINGTTVVLGVNDLVIRQQSAALGNKIVSTSEYFGFVTGDFESRRHPAPAKPSKPTRPGSRVGRRRRRGGAPVRDYRQFDWATAKWAMSWYLFLTYGYTLTRSEARTGLFTPPKNLGISAVMRGRIADRLVEHLMGRAYIRRAQRLDPMRGRGR